MNRDANRTAFGLVFTAATAVFTLLPLASPAAEPAKVTFTETEIKQILTHGPWPAPAPFDAT